MPDNRGVEPVRGRTLGAYIEGLGQALGLNEEVGIAFSSGGHAVVDGDRSVVLWVSMILRFDVEESVVL